MNLTRIRDLYDQRARTYDKTVGCSEKIMLGNLRREFAAELHGQTLEIAIGSGLNLPGYPTAVTRAVGVDLSHGMLREARLRGRSGGDLLLAQMDAQHLAFPDQSFDTVAVSLALCTIPDPLLTLGEIARVCRPGGRIVLLEHVRSPLLPVAVVQRLLSPLQERFIGCHLDRETIALVQRLGFRIVSERRHLIGVFRLVVAEPPVTTVTPG